MRFRSLLLGFAGLLIAVPPAFAQAGDATFKDWWAACDNVRVCTAYGLPVDDAGGAVLRVRREAEAMAVADVDISIGPDEGKGVAGSLTLWVGGRVLARTGLPTGADDDHRTWTVAEGQAPALLDALARGDAMEAKAGDRTVVTISLSGASAALRWVDDRQKRAGGVTALVAKGPAPASAVPSPPALPTVRSAGPVSQKGLTDDPPAAVRALANTRDCQAEPPEGPTSSRLAPGVVLWVIPCWVGAYQISSVLVLADDKGGHPRFAVLEGQGDAEERAMVTGASYDPDTRRLSGYAKGRGVGDCGIAHTYAWTGKAFALVERTELSVCRALSDDFWVTTFRSR